MLTGEFRTFPCALPPGREAHNSLQTRRGKVPIQAGVTLSPCHFHRLNRASAHPAWTRTALGGVDLLNQALVALDHLRERPAVDHLPASGAAHRSSQVRLFEECRR